MSVKKIEYAQKAPFQTNKNIPEINQCTANDMNEIKETVNNNAGELTNLQEGQGTTNGNITALKNRVSTLETDNTTNKADISILKAENETNKRNITNKVDKVEGKGLSTEDFTTELKTKLKNLNNYDDTEIKKDIADIKTGQTTQNEKIKQLDDNQINITTEKSSNINVQDSSNLPAKINVFGISKQEGTPSSEYPAEIENTEGDIDITDCNKNLFDKNKVTDNNYLNENGELTANTLYCVSDFINVVENETYFLPTRGTSRTKFYNKNKQVLTDTWDVADKDKNFVIPANAKYIRFSINKKTVNIDTFQFERNSIETDYIENQQQTITFPLQEGQKLMKGDYLADDGIHHKRKQIEFDGTENWIADNQASPDTCKGWKIQINDYVGREGEFATIGDLHCSHFIERATYHNEVDGIRGGWGKWIFIKMKVEDLSSPDLTGFKAFLSEQKTNGTPVIVEYELKTEEIEAYTEEQQEAYNQLQNAKTYKTVTNVFTENAELQIDYIADTKTYIDNEINNMKEQLNTINELLSTSNTSAMLLNNMQTDLESEVL